MAIEPKKASEIDNTTRDYLRGAFLYAAKAVQQNINLGFGSPFVVGQNYIVLNIVGDDNFSNIGFQYPGGEFTATGTTPTKWVSSSTLVQDSAASAPVITEFYNTIGVITWVKDSSGFVGTGPTFTLNTKAIMSIHNYVLGSPRFTIAKYDNDQNRLMYQVYDIAGVPTTGHSVYIEVYVFV